MIKMTNMEQYSLAYHGEILRKLDPIEVWNELHDLADGVQPIILCWEKPTDFCHRHLVAAWLERAVGKEIKEYAFEHMVRCHGIMTNPQESLI